jgi:hypothetical protein
MARPLRNGEVCVEPLPGTKQTVFEMQNISRKDTNAAVLRLNARR